MREMLKYLGRSFLILIIIITVCFVLSLIEFTSTNKYSEQKQIVKLDTLYTDIDFIGKNNPYGIIIENVKLNENESLYRVEYHDSKDNIHQITFRSFAIYNMQDTIYFTNQKIMTKK